MFAGKKSAQIREILISESAWEEMTCLFAPSLASGALVLSPFLFYHAKTTLSLWRPLSGFYLMVYAVLFSVAYIHLDTGAGALLLFGAVQFAMVIHGLFKGESLSVTGSSSCITPFSLAVLSCQDVVRTRHNTLCREHKRHG